MALTWQDASSPLLPATFAESKSEGSGAPIEYSLRREGGRIVYQVKLPEGSQVTAPVEDIVGGKRHGLSFLARVSALGGLPLARPALIETRYLHSTHENGLVLSAGFPAEKPASYEAALGRVLTPEFEKKCLTCHGEPSANVKLAGVHCEACHGPGQAHLQAVAQGKPRSGIVNPAKLSNADVLERCAQCHAGFSELSDPVPEDLLISNQVNALKNSECYIQSNSGIGCTSCHDAHRDSTDVEAKSVAACRSCHGTAAQLSAQAAGRGANRKRNSADLAAAGESVVRAAQERAGLCPVNQKDGCLKCHMPEVTKGSFTMVDHWIRVHPEQGVGAASHDVSLRTTVRPRRAFLRILVMQDQSKANEVHARLAKGEAFFDLARDNSQDSSAPGGGYIGEMWLDQMDPKLAETAAKLSPGESSPVIENGGKYIILQRMPRDFRWQADQLQQQASALKATGKLDEASAKYLEALRNYPHFLRALIFLGTTVGEQGNAPRAAGVLEFAARLYPKDPAAQYNLGIAYGALGRNADEMRAYQKAIELEPGLLPAYQNLGAALFSAGQLDRAEEVYRKGLEQNPLFAVLYYNLGIIRERQGKTAEAKKAMDLATKIDPEFVKKQQGHP